MLGIIQAGGRSSRMGQDKAWLALGAGALIEHALAALRPATERLGLVINAANPQTERYERLAAEWGATLLFDRHEYRGPLGGIHTALTACTAGEAAFVLACDMPRVSTEFLCFLRSLHEAEDNDVTVPVDDAGRTQMLVGIYSARCLEPVAQMLAAGELKVERLGLRVGLRRVPFAQYAHLPGAAHYLLNLNTPQEYEAVLDA